GVPLIVDGVVAGALGVMDHRAHAWSGEERRMVEDLAAVVVAELALRERRALLESLVEAMGDGVLALDRDRTVLLYNRAAREMFGGGAEVGPPLPADWGERHVTAREDGTPLDPADGAMARGLRGLVTDDLTCAVRHLGNGTAPRWIAVNGQ